MSDHPLRVLLVDGAGQATDITSYVEMDLCLSWTPGAGAMCNVRPPPGYDLQIWTGPVLQFGYALEALRRGVASPDDDLPACLGCEARVPLAFGEYFCPACKHTIRAEEAQAERWARRRRQRARRAGRATRKRAAAKARRQGRR